MGADEWLYGLPFLVGQVSGKIKFHDYLGLDDKDTGDKVISLVCGSNLFLTSII